MHIFMIDILEYSFITFCVIQKILITLNMPTQSKVITSSGPRQAKKCLQACAKCAYSRHNAPAQCLIRAFYLHCYILQNPMILAADSEGPDQTARMRSLIWAFALRICPKTRFRVARPIYSCMYNMTHAIFLLNHTHQSQAIFNSKFVRQSCVSSPYSALNQNML